MSEATERQFERALGIVASTLPTELKTTTCRAKAKQVACSLQDLLKDRQMPPDPDPKKSAKKSAKKTGRKSAKKATRKR